MRTIDRSDMLELTRRMNVNRSCFFRLAGAYMDEDGFVDGSFNTHFLKLSPSDREKNIALAKVIPFAKTNEELCAYTFSDAAPRPGSVRQLLLALRECELKNDALANTFYEILGESLKMNCEYAIYLYYGSYDIPRKGSNQEEMWESEEVYSFLLCAVSPLAGEYEPDTPVGGFLFPAFDNRSTDLTAVDIYATDDTIRDTLKQLLGTK